MHATFWLGIKQGSNLPRILVPYQTNPVPDLHDTRIGLLENAARKIETIYGAGFWSI